MLLLKYFENILGKGAVFRVQRRRRHEFSLLVQQSKM